MKHSLIAFGLVGLLGSTSVMCWSTSAEAGNSSVEATIQSFGDLSMFYQAMLNTGVINELNENQKYTIFAPVNSAFTQISPPAYPCFYAVHCRPQIAALLRDHIILGHHELPDLVTYGRGAQTDGVMRIRVTEPYVHDYAVEQARVLSESEVDGNVIYRIDGVMTTPQELAQFRMIDVMPVADTVTTEKTIVKKTYRNLSAPTPYPAGTMESPELNMPASNSSETTPVIDTYTTPQ